MNELKKKANELKRQAMSEYTRVFSDRLRILMHKNNFKQIDLVKKTGIDKSKISSYLSGKYMPKQDGIFLLAKALNTTEAYLLGLDTPIENKSNIFPNTDQPIKIPLIGKISAGLPILAIENIEGYEFAPSSLIKKEYEYFYLTVQGDSMNLKFRDGDIILVQKQDYLNNGEIGVILIENDATVKKFRKENNMIILEPMSTNAEHQVQIYDKSTNIKIIGKVISYQGRL